jgi:hypothetical protein
VQAKAKQRGERKKPLSGLGIMKIYSLKLSSHCRSLHAKLLQNVSWLPIKRRQTAENIPVMQHHVHGSSSLPAHHARVQKNLRSGKANELDCLAESAYHKRLACSIKHFYSFKRQSIMGKTQFCDANCRRAGDVS